MSDRISVERRIWFSESFRCFPTACGGRVDLVAKPRLMGRRAPGRIFTNPTLIELRQEIGQYDWLASPRADDVVLCSRTEIITKQAIECGL
ncbi:hypothetical protein AVEN_5676-1 [Araneus ventricosus]|uniref:Uncharacterized protein n=1 Tax=Araneus ventricosus TaxID=182803 RepID=A0A4Y2DV04_ARAVE|nr:hypothetical protein AVEN_5676-1 [Araneus ventricosus]